MLALSWCPMWCSYWLSYWLDWNVTGSFQVCEYSSLTIASPCCLSYWKLNTLNCCHDVLVITLVQNNSSVVSTRCPRRFNSHVFSQHTKGGKCFKLPCLINTFLVRTQPVHISKVLAARMSALSFTIPRLTMSLVQMQFSKSLSV